MYTQYVNGYDKAMSVFQDTMKENPEFANLVTQFQVQCICTCNRCHLTTCNITTSLYWIEKQKCPDSKAQTLFCYVPCLSVNL